MIQYQCVETLFLKIGDYMKEKNLDRRSFFTMALSAVTIVPLALRSFKAEAAAPSCPAKAPVGKNVADPAVGMGKSLEYVVDAGASKNAKYKAGQNCLNCKYYNDKKVDGGYAPCTMMGMKLVSSCGWCKSYLVK